MQINFLSLNDKYRHDLADFIAKQIAVHAGALAADPVKNEAEINRIIDSVLTLEEQSYVGRLYELYSREPTDEESEALLKRQQFHIV